MNPCLCPLGAFPSTEDVTCKENFGQIQKVIFVDLLNYGKGRTYLGFTHDSGISIFEEAAIHNEALLIVDFIPTTYCEGILDSVRKFVNIAEGKGISYLFEVITGGRNNEEGDNYYSEFGIRLMSISPFLEAPSQEPGEARTFGGGNDTPNGVEKFLGMGPSTFSAVMRGVPQKAIADMKQLVCLSRVGRLGVILINADGYFEMLDTGKDVVVTIPGAAGPSSYPAYWPIPIRNLQISDKVHGGFEQPDYNEISWEFLPNYSDQLVVVSNELYLRGDTGTGKSLLDIKNNLI